ncbi:TIGR03016 family PEP-CTERM system-associated outer membrane protein [Dechloromonas sp. XY25]|uniref:TIGR03016 family PEP-CTERM system-associated outer membrane protein n=1 Tax=Dechloromonas hankyongensis TaxID=2908002 RepID=A0ABS9K3H7_9RHOO|nr:TIGR03016 family PEP-CTERM system-associated outer membrane protein [Dechloromonas hankyongensis]MCG2577738.1 TIGR03016 family PEP-CTERM system-associated outer membrane protein [Dechloromonas hankyongensis]
MEMKKNKPLKLLNKSHLAIACFSVYSLTVWSQQAITGSALSTTPVAGDNTPQSQTGQPSALSLDNAEGEKARAFVIKPRIRLGETWSDNVDVGRSQNRKTSGLITEIAPGIHVDARTARLQAYFDYSLIGLYYTEPSGYSRTQNALNTFGTLEAISNWFYLDFSAVIAQQAISAFGTQTGSTSYQNSNSTETGTYRLSPYIRGRLGNDVNYLLRYNWSTTQASANNVSDIDLSEWSGQLSGGTAFKNLRWSVDASQQTAEYSLGRKTEAERLYATATYQIVPQFRVSLSGGQESNNYASTDQISHNTSGYGFDWNPTERTQFSVFKERRFFGNGHRINFSHRFPLTTITYTDTRDVSVLPNQFSSVGVGTIYDLVYQTALIQVAKDPSFNGNPVLIAQEAASRTNLLLLAYGIPANTQVTSSFLSSRATVQRRQQLSFVMQGARNILTLMVNRNENQSILATQAVNDDFFANNMTGIRQTGFSINLAHRLSEQSSLNVLATRQNSDSLGNNTLRTSITTYQANLISKVGSKTSATVGVRRTEFDSPSNPYVENAVLGSISITY